MKEKGCGDSGGDGTVLSAMRTVLCGTTILSGHVKAGLSLGAGAAEPRTIPRYPGTVTLPVSAGRSGLKLLWH